MNAKVPETALIYATSPDEPTATSIAKALVSEGLAACVNVIPGMTSVYQWEGAVQTEREFAMIMKAAGPRVKELIERFVALHPYDVPAIVAIPVVAGNDPFVDWVAQQTGQNAR